LSSSSSIQTSSFSIMFSLGRGGISYEATRSLSQKEGLVMVDCCRSGGFLVCSMLVSPCAVKTNSVFIAIDLVLTRTVSTIFFTSVKEMESLVAIFFSMAITNRKLVVTNCKAPFG